MSLGVVVEVEVEVEVVEVVDVVVVVVVVVLVVLVLVVVVLVLVEDVLWEDIVVAAKLIVAYWAWILSKSSAYCLRQILNSSVFSS